MLIAQVESYLDLLPALLPLYNEHWLEVALDQDRPRAALKPRFDIYEARHAAGELVLVTLRDACTVVGYFICFVSRGLHYGDCLTAQMDIIYVHPSVRCRFGSLRLIRTMKQELQRRGADRWFVGEKIGRSSGLGRIYELLGFRAVETYYSMWIGPE